MISRMLSAYGPRVLAVALVSVLCLGGAARAQVGKPGEKPEGKPGEKSGEKSETVPGPEVEKKSDANPEKKSAGEDIEDLFEREEEEDKDSQKDSKKETEDKKEDSDREPARERDARRDGPAPGTDDRPGYQLDVMAAADIYGAWDNEGEHTTDNRVILREAEVGFRAAVDHLGEGYLALAAHNEDGELTYEVHEAYFFFSETFLPNTSIKLGKFYYDIGRLNTVHRHERPFTRSPIVHEELLDEEGVEDTGIEFRVLMPWDFWQELSIGVFNGRTFGHAHEDGDPKNNPLVALHLKQFFPLGADWGTQFGFTYIRRHPSANPRRVTHQSGLDWLLKWRRGKLRSFQALTEVWYRETRQTRSGPFAEPAPPVETRAGGYLFLEYQFHENWFAGTRFDAFTDPNKRGELGYTIKNGVFAESAMLTYRPSEFSYFRGTVERTTDVESGERTHQFYAQATFLIGKHPAHVY